jgi:hypothetical protein
VKLLQFRELRVEASCLTSNHAVVAGIVFRWTAHHVREIFSALLPRGYVLDGSSVIQVTCGPRGDNPQYFQCLGSSEYFVEDFDFASYARALPPVRERVVLATVEAALCDIADRVGAEKTALQNTASAVIECGFCLSTEVPKLRKTMRPSGRSLRVFRCLGTDLGETWLVRVVGRDKAVIAEIVMGKTPDYLNRRDYFKVAELIDGCYVVRDNLGWETFRLDLAGFTSE